MNYRSVIHKFKELFDSVNLDVDFSEKLKVPLKYEPQSMHWIDAQIIVHSAILKTNGEKEYHAYLSDDLIQDHVFVNCVLDKLLSNVSFIESDNCTLQYKCAAEFKKEIADQYMITVIQVYSIAGHGKCEVDHVGDLSKSQ